MPSVPVGTPRKGSGALVLSTVQKWQTSRSSVAEQAIRGCLATTGYDTPQPSHSLAECWDCA